MTNTAKSFDILATILGIIIFLHDYFLWCNKIIFRSSYSVKNFSYKNTYKYI